jgi:hypothetical protein
MRNEKFTPVQKVTFSAMLIALAVIATFLAKTISMGPFYYLRFSLTPALIIYTSLALGPFYGALVGAAADLIPAFALSQGEYNFLITIVYVILGVLPWLLEKLTKRFRSSLKSPYYFYGLLTLLFIALVCIFYATPLLDSSFMIKNEVGDTYDASVWAKPTILGVVFLLDVGLGVGLYFTNRYYQKRILDYPDIPSPNEIAIIGLISEVVVMDFLKAGAFWVFYNWVSSNTFPLSFGFVFSMLIMGAPLNVLLIVFADSWLLIFTKRFLHQYGYPTIGGAKDDKQGTESLEAPKSADDLVDEKSDEDLLEQSRQKHARIGWIIFFVVLILAMVACIIVIELTKNPDATSSSLSLPSRLLQEIIASSWSLKI